MIHDACKLNIGLYILSKLGSFSSILESCAGDSQLRGRMMMGLPKSHLKSSRGQILIIFLLILVVAAAIVLSVASRTVTDIRTTTTSDESNRAYFAAEAGIEEALQRTGSGSFNLNFTTNNTTAQVNVSAAEGLEYFIYPNDLNKDEVAQVALLSNFAGDVTDAANTGWDGSGFNFYWGASPHDPANPNVTPAIEVSVVYYCPGPGICTAGNFGISKTTFDPFIRGNNFCTNVMAFPSGSPYTIENKSFYFMASATLFAGSEFCGASGTSNPSGFKLNDAVSTKPVLARIRLLYNSNQPSPLAVEVGDEGDPPLPAQGSLIESSGQTTSGVTRKLQVTRLFPALPALFDYVLFNGSTNALTK